MAVFGGGALPLYSFGGDAAAAPLSARLELDRLLVRLTAVGAAAALLSAVAIIPVTAAEMAGSDTAALDPGIWHAVLFATEFGRVWCWHIGFAAALLALSLL